jgi:hypothetical protein
MGRFELKCQVMTRRTRNAHKKTEAVVSRMSALRKTGLTLTPRLPQHITPVLEFESVRFGSEEKFTIRATPRKTIPRIWWKNLAR